ncbi:anti-phage deoxyguanosine triphosphatase [Pectobacterium carotovorum]|uniref:anti-phage deoxyguanosine triphosphatase n=1 Tax=Pectobacterium carotovorum TaxID=554 RepID=UPI00301776CC
MSDIPNWEERIVPAKDTENIRNNYGRDRARIIHSAFFRRLQAKTQVLGLGDGDFYRTRLTHSLEVAQIGNGISEFLRYEEQFEEYIKWLPEQNLIESIGLAHDIGHPPFGHGGEVALNYSMRNDGGFEGNAQTLRICCKLGEYSEKNGLNLTRRTLLGLVKYPVTYNNIVNNSIYLPKEAPLRLDSFKPPKCIYDCENEDFNWITNTLPEKDKELFISHTQTGKHAKSLFKGFDTSIMELADDIAYGVHDLEDAIALGLVKEREWMEQVHSVMSDELHLPPLSKELKNLTRELFSGENKTRKKAISFLVNYFIRNCEIIKKEKFEHNLIDLEARQNQHSQAELSILKNFVIRNVIKTPEVQTLEYKGQQMIIKIFEAIANNPERLLPRKYLDSYIQQNKNLRVICDYISGTTDDYATMLYHKIFTPSYGSIFERL